MPKFGLKCFIGSFLLSLAAIFAATKAYIVMSLQEEKQEISVLAASEAKNIELFAANEENDPIYEKYKTLEQANNAESRIINAENNETTEVLSANNKIGEPAETSKVLDIASEETESSQPLVLAEDEKLSTDIFSADELKTEEDELQIMEASAAESFIIPIKHNFTASKMAAEITNRATNSQIASASNNVAIDNLGIEKMATITQSSELTASAAMPKAADDDPWEVAETANQYTAKNAHAKKKAQPVTDGSEVDENGRPVYKMQKNLLIPIPEDIMNEKNLTPQFSSSAENKKIEEKLRRESGASKKIVPQVAPKNVEEEVDMEDEEISKSLSDSIAEWFAGSKSDTKNKNETKKTSTNNSDQDNSIFHKLLGIERKSEQKKEDNITPTELKLAFQPNRAEISGQTLEWLHAFSENAVKYENVIIEIRISQTAPRELQQKRLNLLYRILADNGVNYEKINIIFTDREPNSFIIRNVRYATEEEVAAARLKAAKEAAEAAQKALEEEKAKAKKDADNPWF